MLPSSRWACTGSVMAVKITGMSLSSAAAKQAVAQGVAMAAALSRGVTVSEYAPRRIKQAITGQGAASKEQVAIILKKLLRLEELPRRLDATDGLAVAVCHFFQSAPVTALESLCRKKALGGGPASVSWERFISDHPERVKK